MKIIKIKGLVIFAVLCFFFKNSFAQQDHPTPTYPSVAGFFAVFVPIVIVSNGTSTTNFSNTSMIAFPFGFNLLKSNRWGYSMEMVPFIFAQKGSSRLQFVLFHPGFMFRFDHGFTFIPRLAFQTDGRYGFTPVFSKIILRAKDYQVYISLSEGARFGNNLPAAFITSGQVGISF
ncbi:MAG TPA: hypothetical protein VF974_03920 [Patescibacteria group bacterium]